ncbi:hypothetical protein RB195_014955 [Necator americanus]
MEILVMVVAAVIIFQEILGCTRQERQKPSSRRMQEDKENKKNTTSGKSLPKPKGKEKLDVKTALPRSQPSCETQAETQILETKDAEKKIVEKGPKTEATKYDETTLLNPPKVNPRSKGEVISNPIVTPVTDEFPTEDKEESKFEIKEEEKGKDEEKKFEGGQLKQAKKEDIVNYEAKKKKQGAERNVSNPIVTPVSDEFPTEEEVKGAKKEDVK